MRLLLLFSICWLFTINASQIGWENFKTKFLKSYKTSAEENFRKSLFEKNVKIIENHNKLYELNKVLFKMKVNRFSDLNFNDFVKFDDNFNPVTADTIKDIDKNKGPPQLGLMSGQDAPSHFDWHVEGATSSQVVDEGEKCSSSYAITVAEAIESHVFIKTNVRHRLSAQQILDCSQKFKNFGCASGLSPYAFDYLKSVGGIVLEQDYPYLANVTVCADVSKKDKIKVDGYNLVPFANEKSLKFALTAYGPIVAGIHSSLPSFHAYTKGIYYDPNCDANKINHFILIIGYGTTKEGDDYWLFKNVWGWEWGMKGYGLLARNKNNHCGVASIATYPIIKDGKLVKSKNKKPKKKNK